MSLPPFWQAALAAVPATFAAGGAGALTMRAVDKAKEGKEGEVALVAAGVAVPIAIGVYGLRRRDGYGRGIAIGALVGGLACAAMAHAVSHLFDGPSTPTPNPSPTPLGNFPLSSL